MTATWFGINAPFIGGSQNILSRQEDERLIKNDLLQLLLTAPGERVMRPDFGTSIREFLFENANTVDLDELRTNIETQIEIFETRVTITDIQINPNEDENLLDIKIFGFLNIDRFDPNILLGTNVQADLLIELNLPTAKEMQSA